MCILFLASSDAWLTRAFSPSNYSDDGSSHLTVPASEGHGFLGLFGFGTSSRFEATLTQSAQFNPST